jgi:CRISPR-associated protein Cmr1
VRGLGGYACDPTDTKCDGENHCVSCELFGCTGWARKFRLHILDKDKNIKTTIIDKNDDVIFKFIPLRPIKVEEWAILDLTLHLIAEYGAMGGKTIFKPSDENRRGKNFHHKDFGLIKIIKSNLETCPKEQVLEYVKENRWRKVKHDNYTWVSIKIFWCVNGRYLTRTDYDHSSFNKVIGRPEPKRDAYKNDSWLAGRRPNPQKHIDAESKKVFSFKQVQRTYGFVNSTDVDFQQIKAKLKQVWIGMEDKEFRTGETIINQILIEANRGD